MKRLLIATQNIGKLSEIKSILKDLDLKLFSLKDIGFDSQLPETGSTFKQNAVMKAKKAGQLSNVITLAEDSGLEVDYLQGAPGVFSARFAKGTDRDRIDKLLKKLKDVPKDERGARFVTVVALYNPKDNKIYTFEGESKGRITDRPFGSQGFGYDPVFFNLDLGKTNAQASDEEKNSVSHRKKALMKARSILANFQ